MNASAAPPLPRRRMVAAQVERDGDEQGARPPVDGIEPERRGPAEDVRGEPDDEPDESHFLPPKVSDFARAYFVGHRRSSRNTSMARAAPPTVSATAGARAVSSASGTSSAATSQSIAPAANPSPTGSTPENASTKRNAGTAISGWGRLEKTLQAAAFRTEVPRGTRTRLMARPSGALCTAIAIAMRMPSVSAPPKATPTPTPSVNEWRVMTPTISSARL